MSSLKDMFKSPFKLISEETNELLNPIPNKIFTFKTSTIRDTTTKAEIFNAVKKDLDAIKKKYKNYIIDDTPSTESVYKVNIGIHENDGITTKDICRVSVNHISNAAMWVTKIMDEPEVKGEFFIAILVILTAFQNTENDSDSDFMEDEEEYKIRKTKREDECVICCKNPSNILYTECLHMVVCNECDATGNLSKCPFCRKKIKNQRILFS